MSSRSWARERRSSLETCIWETPSAVGDLRLREVLPEAEIEDLALVVRCHRVDDAIAQPLDQRVAIPFTPQGRVDLEQRRRIGKLGGRKPHRQVMRRDLGGDREAIRAGLPNELHGGCAGEMLKMQAAAAGEPQRLERGAHGGGLRCLGPVGGTRERDAGVVAGGDHRLVLGVHEHRPRDISGAAQELCKHRHRRGVAPVVAEGDGTGRRTGADVDQLLAAETAAGRRRHEDLDRRPGSSGAGLRDSLGSVCRRLGVGHGNDLREAAGSSALAPAARSPRPRRRVRAGGRADR